MQGGRFMIRSRARVVKRHPEGLVKALAPTSGLRMM
jgi:hypothetical protein